MFFEDEKENIGNNSDMQIDNDTTSWDGILDDGDDDLISIKDSSSQTQDFNDDDEISGLSSMGLDDELKLIDDDIISDNVEDVDDDELARILNDEPSPKEKAFDAFGSGSDSNDDIVEEDFNMDDELGDLTSGQQYDYSPEEDSQEVPQENYQAQQEPAQEDDEDDEIVYQPQQTQKKQGTSPLLLAVFFATMAAFGVYWFLNQNKDEVAAPIQPVSNFSQEDNQNIAVDNSQENIPVVNEEEVDMIKPDIPEKKEVISVQSAGKVNPFLPIQKYIAIDTSAIQTTYNYDAVAISKPPSDYGEMNEVATKLMSISVSGIMYDDVKPSAIITLDDNDYFVQKGDKLDDYRVVEIARNNVKIALGNNIYKANLGEEFKIDTFYGNAKYLPSQQGGGRQYHSVSEEEMESMGSKGSRKTSSSRSSRYTSEDDVNVNQRYR